MINLLKHFKGTWLHPQWLTDRYHNISRQHLSSIRNSVTLDIGSGNSDHSNLLGENVNLIKIDYPDTNCRYQNFPDAYCDATNLPFLDNSVNVVLLLEVIEHIPNYQSVLNEINRVLKEDGYLYLSAPFIYPVHDQPFDFHRYSIYGLRHDLLESGFSVRDEFQHGNSIVVALQMLNLAILELVKKILDKKLILGVVLALIAYPACLIINLFAIPFINISLINSAVFGHFVIAEPI